MGGLDMTRTSSGSDTSLDSFTMEVRDEWHRLRSIKEAETRKRNPGVNAEANTVVAARNQPSRRSQRKKVPAITAENRVITRRNVVNGLQKRRKMR